MNLEELVTTRNKYQRRLDDKTALQGSDASQRRARKASKLV